MSGDTPVWAGGVVVEGIGLAFVGNELTVATRVTTLSSVDSLYPSGTVPSGSRVTFSDLSLSAADTMAILQGNTTRLDNIIAANSWNYTGSAGDDSFTSGNFADVLLGGGGSDTLRGEGGNDNIQGGDGIDLLYGGAGNDRIDGGAGSTDLMYGGTGDDRFYVDSYYDRVRESVGEGYDTVYASDNFKLFATAEIEVLSVVSRGTVTTVDLSGTTLHRPFSAVQAPIAFMGSGATTRWMEDGAPITYPVEPVRTGRATSTRQQP